MSILKNEIIIIIIINTFVILSPGYMFWSFQIFIFQI